jgi:1-acyl-sn-glycerol-3-phosphate acyltransferase
MLYALLKPLVLALLRLWCRVEGRGVEHLPPAGAALIVANHASVLDPPLVGAVAPRKLCFLAKAELFEVPLFGRLIWALNARPVRREGSDPRALKSALRLLEEGRALLLFPEGTRSPDGALRPAKAGAGMLAVMSGAPVIPAYISGSGRALPRGRVLPRPARVRVTFGPPLQFAGGGEQQRKERYREAAEAMMRAIADLRDRAQREQAGAAAA